MRMRRIFLLLLFVCGMHLHSFAQYKLSLNFIDTSGTPVQQVSVSIRKPASNMLIAFRNTGNGNQANFEFQALKSGDSIIIETHHAWYQPGFDTIMLGNEMRIYRELTLYPLVKQLTEVVVQPTIWKRGDTTFYQVDSFKLGNERKLNDILQQLPGIRIDEGGNIVFKGKPVSRILVDGAALFSERNSLLLESFPAHVIEQIQVIENSQSNALLKGINSGNETLLNIKVKKKYHRPFGDAEVTAATDSRYDVAGAIFSPLRKIKWAYNGTYSTLGKTLQPALQTNRNYYAPAFLKLQAPQPEVINNFSNSRYLPTRIQQHEVSGIIPLMRRVQIETEITAATLTTNQQTNTSAIWSDTLLPVVRNEENHYQGNMRLLRLSQKTIFYPGGHTQLKMAWNVQHIRDMATFQSAIQQNDFQDTIPYQYTSGQLDYQFATQLTKRVDSMRAFIITYELKRGNADRKVQSQHASWKQFFGATDQTWLGVSQQFCYQLMQQELRFERLSKKETGNQTDAWLVRDNQLLPQQHFVLEHPARPSLPFPALRTNDRIRLVQAGYQLVRALKWGQNGLKLRSYAGVGWAKRGVETGGNENRWFPELDVRIEKMFSLHKAGIISGAVQLLSKGPDITQLPDFLMPEQLGRFSVQEFPLRSLTGLHSEISWTRGKVTGNIHSLRISATRNFFMPAFETGIQQFLWVSRNVILNRFSHDFSITGNHQIVFTDLKATWHQHYSVFVKQAVMNDAVREWQELYNVFAAYGSDLNWRATVKDRLVPSVQFIYRQNIATQGSEIPAALIQPVVNLNLRLQWTHRFSRQFFAGTDLHRFWFDLQHPDKLSLLFHDVFAEWKSAKSGWDIRLRMENVWNQRHFQIQQVLFAQIQQTRIPLFGRNLQFSLRFNF